MLVTQQHAGKAPTTTRILLISETFEDVQTIQQMLSCSKGIHLALGDYRANIFTQTELNDDLDYDLILFDRDSAQTHCLDAYHAVCQMCLTKPVIILSENFDEEVANLALQQGVQDYLLKTELNATVLNRAIRYALRRHQPQLTLIQKAKSLQKILLDLKQANRTLRQLATTDGLTNVFNRRYFNTALATEWSRAAREQQSISLILGDIDFFKAYNDTYGHRAGDHCLLHVAQAMLRAVNRSTDVVTRYGGEEFAILLPNTNRNGAFTVAQHMHQAIAQSQIKHIRSSVSDVVTMSFGVATQVPIHGVEASELIEAADRALYIAKEKGRNQIHRSPAHMSLPKERTYPACQKMTSKTSPLNVDVAS